MLVDGLELNSARGITFINFVPNIRIVRLERHMKVFFLMAHYML